MLFNTISFVVFFITVLTVIAVIKNRTFQHLFLLVSSYFFFFFSSNYLITLLVYTTIWDYYLGKAIFKTVDIKRKKIILIISLAGNLGLLGFFKYADFAVTQFNILGNYFDLNTHIPLLNLALPIGISFYTFHSITYTVGIYRGDLKPTKSLLDYAIFVAFFPQLVAGPILRAKDFLPQLREKLENFNRNGRLRQIFIQEGNLKLGITIMALGFCKKMFFADNLAPLVNEVFNNPISHDSFTVILGTITFGIQIYCDFSGYTDIAIGAATMMGFKIPINFNKPYFATSPSDFWKRWHISLSLWLRDYLYIPLGGNRKSSLRTYLNLFIVMLLGGLWHGASLNFILWGFLHGLYLSLHKVIISKLPVMKNNHFIKTRFAVGLSIFISQYFIFLAWIVFRVKDYHQMFYAIQKYVLLDFQILETKEFIFQHKLPMSLLLLFFVAHYISYKKGNIREKISGYNIWLWTLFLTGIVLLILFFFNGHPEDFIYFKF